MLMTQKFICDQNNLSIWSHVTHLQFSFNKCVVLLCGANNSNLVHSVCGQILPTADLALDLRVTRSTNICYSEHFNNLFRCSNSTSALILHIFSSCNISYVFHCFVA